MGLEGLTGGPALPDDDERKRDEQQEQQQEEEEQEQPRQPVTSSDIQLVITTIAKEAPYDVISIKQIFYGMCSAFTKLPLHHSVNSRKAGAGKTHNLTKTANYFPKKYVIAMAGMSDKALFHRHGTPVIVDDETGNTIPVKPLIDDINHKIENLESKSANSESEETKKKEIKKEIAKLRGEIQEINEKSQKLIELDNKIFLFLDTAQEGLFNTLMSMIS